MSNPMYSYELLMTRWHMTDDEMIQNKVDYFVLLIIAYFHALYIP